MTVKQAFLWPSLGHQNLLEIRLINNVLETDISISVLFIECLIQWMVTFDYALIRLCLVFVFVSCCLFVCMLLLGFLCFVFVVFCFVLFSFGVFCGWEGLVLGFYGVFRLFLLLLLLLLLILVLFIIYYYYYYYYYYHHHHCGYIFVIAIYFFFFRIRFC